MSLLIKNGTIVNAMEEYKSDILVENGKIVAIGKNLNVNAKETVDAQGMYVLPGGVDQHVHFSFEFNGQR